MNALNKKVNHISNNFQFTNILGLSRSTLALGTLLTLCLNPISNFFYVLENGTPANTLLPKTEFINTINFFLLFGSEYLYITHILAIIILTIVILGVAPKITSILHWWVVWSFMMFSSAVDGGDQIANNIAFLFIFICWGDNRNNHWQKPKKEKSHFRNITGYYFLQLIRLQTAIIYFHASVGKFPVQEWMQGTAVYYWFNNAVFGMPDYIKPILNPILTNNIGVALITYGTLFFELILFLCFVMPIKYRKYFFIPAILFHFSIIIIHGIFSFFFSMLAIIIVYLLNYYKPLNFNLCKSKKSSSASI